MQPNTHTRPRAVSGVGRRDGKAINGDVSMCDFFRHGVTRANTLVPLGEPTRHSSHDTVCMCQVSQWQMPAMQPRLGAPVSVC